MDANAQLRDDLQKLMTRFGKAGWIDSSMVSPNPCKIDFTPLGTERMTEIVEHLRDLEASGLEPTSVSGAELGQIIHELMPPGFSKTEMKTLLSLTDMFRQKMGL
ncbi:MAG TPA: hypothetical protein VFC17_08840 [Candidatus Limnocylindrales bacterium]|nr:hypothetical protein [Candidatus Limnocylindrales bacterium]